MSKLFFTAAETAEALDCTIEDLKDYVRQGLLREFRDGDAVNYKTTEIEKLVEEKSALKEALEGDHPVRPPHAPLKMPSQQWLADAAALEDGCESISAGGPSLDRVVSAEQAMQSLLRISENKIEGMLRRCVGVMILVGFFAAICTISLIVSLVTK